MSEKTPVAEAAAQTSTTDTINGGVTADQPQATTNPLAPAPGDSPQLSRFKVSVVAALGNPEFTGDIKKIDKATQSVSFPNPEDRVRAQLRAHAEKNLRAKAALEAERTGNYVAPTEADFIAYVEAGVSTWRDKQPK